MAELTTQLKKDYEALMECFWEKKINHAKRLAGVKKFLAQHKRPPYNELEKWLRHRGNSGLWRDVVPGAQDRRWASPKELEIMKLLLASGLSLNSSRNLSGTSEVAVHGECSAPLNKAIANGDLALVKLYLAAAADPNTMADGVPPLFVAVIKNNLPLVKVLLKAGADPKKKITFDKTPGFGILAYLHRELRLVNKINNWCRDFQAENFKNFNEVKAMIKLLCRAGVAPDEKIGPAKKSLVQLLAAEKKKISFSDYNNHEELSDIEHWSVLLTELANQRRRER